MSRGLGLPTYGINANEYNYVTTPENENGKIVASGNNLVDGEKDSTLSSLTAKYSEENMTEHMDFNQASYNLLERILSDCQVKMEATYIKAQSVVEYQGFPIVRTGNITTIKGHAKSAKTFLTTIFASVLNGGEYMGINATQQSRTLFIDTEQSKCDTQELMFRIRKMVQSQGNDYDDSRIHVANIRRLEISDRLDIIENVLKTGMIDVVILDGIKDLIADINNPDSCTHLMTNIVRMCEDYNCSFITVIHTNKNDENPRGHLGTELMNKSDVVINLEKKGNIIQVSPYLTRKEPFPTFYYTIHTEDDGIAVPILVDANGMVELFAKKSSPKRNNQIDEKKAKIDDMLAKMDPNKEYTTSEIANLCNGSQSSYKRYLDGCVDKGIITQTVNKRYRLKQV